MRIHPYALIIGLAIGFGVMATLRHPPFALFAAIVSVVLLDMGFKQSRNTDDGDPDA